MLFIGSQDRTTKCCVAKPSASHRVFIQKRKETFSQQNVVKMVGTADYIASDYIAPQQNVVKIKSAQSVGNTVIILHNKML